MIELAPAFVSLRGRGVLIIVDTHYYRKNSHMVIAGLLSISDIQIIRTFRVVHSESLLRLSAINMEDIQQSLAFSRTQMR